MPALLIDRAMDLVTPDLISRSSTFFDEPESTLRKGFSAAVPVVLASVANRADDPWFVGRLYDMATSPDNDPGVLDDVSRLVGSRPSRASVQGHEFISLLSGGRTERFHGTLSRFSGIRPSTAAALLAMVGPVVLGLLGRAVRQGNLAATGLSDMLRAQKSSIASRMPGDVSGMLSEFAGFGEREEPSYRESRYDTPRMQSERPSWRFGARTEARYRPERRTQVWRWVVPAALVAGGLWALSARARNRTVVEA